MKCSLPAFVALLLLLFTTVASSMTTPIQITVFSDLAWPWCYVAQTRLRKAMTEFEAGNHHTPIELEWKPFMIDPGTNLQGEEFEAYCRRRWGSSGWTGHLRSEGRKDGGSATFANWKWWPHTARAHQLVEFGQQHYNADTDAINKVLFEALYEHGVNLSNVDELVALVETHFGDWDVAALRTYLTQNQGLDAVQSQINQGRAAYKISGVPYFVMGRGDNSRRPYGFSGAQSTQTFRDLLHELAE